MDAHYLQVTQNARTIGLDKFLLEFYRYEFSLDSKINV